MAAHTVTDTPASESNQRNDHPVVRAFTIRSGV
jgi:hypothetical protein